MSGRPGRSRTSRRKRKPRRCSRLRIRSSGFVLRPRMPDIIRLRVAASTISTIYATWAWRGSRGGASGTAVAGTLEVSEAVLEAVPEDALEDIPDEAPAAAGDAA